MKESLEPTIEAIRGGKLIESSSCDFKGRLNLDEQREKSNFVNDVVAFLNMGAGHLVIGVHQKRGSFHSFEPIRGSKDDIGVRLISIIQDNIEPKPLGVDVRFLDVDDGFIVDIDIPEHRLRPYQNKITGSFYIRTGAKNAPLTREQVRAMFVSVEQVETDTLNLMKNEDATLEKRDIMQTDGSTLHIAIVPYQHYERDREPFDPGSFQLKTFPKYHFSERAIFKGCENGVESLDWYHIDKRVNSRFFISDDWLVHSYVVYAITVDDSGRLKLCEFFDALARHLRNIQAILDASHIGGPYGVMLAVRNLQIEKIAWAFPDTSSASLARPMLVERVYDETLFERFVQKIRIISIHGRSG